LDPGVALSGKKGEDETDRGRGRRLAAGAEVGGVRVGGRGEVVDGVVRASDEMVQQCVCCGLGVSGCG